MSVGRGTCLRLLGSTSVRHHCLSPPPGHRPSPKADPHTPARRCSPHCCRSHSGPSQGAGRGAISRRAIYSSGQRCFGTGGSCRSATRAVRFTRPVGQVAFRARAPCPVAAGRGRVDSFGGRLVSAVAAMAGMIGTGSRHVPSRRPGAVDSRPPEKNHRSRWMTFPNFA